jgi:hypothetical protein
LDRFEDRAVRLAAVCRIGSEAIKPQCSARKALGFAEEVLNRADEPVLALVLACLSAVRSDGDINVRSKMCSLTISIEFELD